MKKNLGNLLNLTLVSLVTWGTLHAYDTYTLEAQLSKHSLVQHEAVVLTLSVLFSQKGDNLGFVFTPTSDENVTYKLINQKESFNEEHKRLDYEYLLFFHHASKQTLQLQGVMNFHTVDSIRYGVGGRDEGWLEDSTVSATKEVYFSPIDLAVIPNVYTATGSYTLTSTIDKTKIAPFEPLHVTLHLTGIGNVEEAASWKPSIENVKLFAGTPRVTKQLTNQGIAADFNLPYALTSDHNFTVPTYTFTYFDVSKQQPVTLQTEPTPIIVESNTSLSQEGLLDQQSYPQPFDITPHQQGSIYFGIWLFGFLSGIAVWRKWRQRTIQQPTSAQMIESTKTLKELLMLLFSMNATLFEQEITQLEEMLYRQANHDLSRIKKAIRQKLSKK